MSQWGWLVRRIIEVKRKTNQTKQRRANRCCEIAGADSAHEPAKKRILVRERQRPTFVRGFLENAGWIVPGTILALLPKCPACVATYALIGTGVGFSLSGTTYLRTLLVILCAVSLLYLVARRMRPFIAMLFASHGRKAREEVERPWTMTWVRQRDRYTDQ